MYLRLKSKSAQPKLRTEKCKAPIAATQFRSFNKMTRKEHALLPMNKSAISFEGIIKLCRTLIIAQYLFTCQYLFQIFRIRISFSDISRISSADLETLSSAPSPYCGCFGCQISLTARKSKALKKYPMRTAGNTFAQKYQNFQKNYPLIKSHKYA